MFSFHRQGKIEDLIKKYMVHDKADLATIKCISEIINHPSYELLMNVFEVNSKEDCKDIEQSLLKALSKGI